MEGNEQLAALMRQAGFLKDDGSVGLKVFARAVGRHAGRTFTHTYVRRWLGGMVPRDPQTRHAITKALGERLGRSVDQHEVGFGGPRKISPDLGLSYSDDVYDGIAALTGLWQADLDNVSSLLTVPANIAAWSEASLSWLVTTRQDAIDGTGQRRVGHADIAGIRDTTGMFDRLDGQHGGGHARRALVEFLRTDVAALLNGSYSSEVGRELYREAAQATLLGAWMSYDAGLHGLAQRYFIQALRLAESTGDRLLGASILDAMSHQATFLGRYREAANLARAARMGTETAGSSSALAHFYAMEARALARLGDTAECDRAMAAAVREFERRNPENDPADWFGYFNESELAAELGHCNRDLGRSVDASTYASQSLGPTASGYVRSDFFATMVLADAYLDQGEAEQACKIALDALQIGERLKSARCGAYVGEFRERLSRLGKSAAVADFVEQASETRLWTPDA
ncbi:XRE family transcriptional regulator [Amycolatopsis pithecellobii]|uniref:XRE family transcriptional regulator n=1 Tax=Amycolatopsis pithecellobii TaxID=664692 RepID=A0A6N7ZAR2_9PSEU|nr:XRE family transcriptional regulator [Amycolatopsis pithecellobii]MTD58765.1 XRE family transcriptional regulator [Amycolatopsis pithecellobii]